MSDNQNNTELNQDFGYSRKQYFSRTLKAKAIVKDKKMKGDDNSAIIAANKALDVLSKEFKSWMETEVMRLEEEYYTFAEMPYEVRDTSKLFRAAHDLRGQAPIYGYPLIGDIAGSLSKLLDLVDRADLPLTLVEHHINAIKIIYKNNIKDYSDKTSNDVLNSLLLVIDNLIQKINKQAS